MALHLQFSLINYLPYAPCALRAWRPVLSSAQEDAFLELFLGLNHAVAVHGQFDLEAGRRRRRMVGRPSPAPAGHSPFTREGSQVQSLSRPPPRPRKIALSR
jgi:hypothetical protein